jgi:hypothetical protein
MPKQGDARRRDFRLGLIVLAGAIALTSAAAVWSSWRVDSAQDACLQTLDEGIQGREAAALEEAARCYEDLAKARPLWSARNLFRAEVSRSLNQRDASEISRWPRELDAGLDRLEDGDYEGAASRFAEVARIGGPSAGVARRFERLSHELRHRHDGA